MGKINLLALITLLYAREKTERAAIVKETAKENAVDANELFKALKAAGYDPKAEKGTAVPSAENAAQTPPPPPDGNNTQNAGTDAATPNVAQPGASPPPSNSEGGSDKTITVTLRHKTEYPHYRRAALVLKQTPQAFSVTEAQLALLMLDKWVEIIEGGETK